MERQEGTLDHNYAIGKTMNACLIYSHCIGTLAWRSLSTAVAATPGGDCQEKGDLKGNLTGKEGKKEGNQMMDLRPTTDRTLNGEGTAGAAAQEEIPLS